MSSPGDPAKVLSLHPPGSGAEAEGERASADWRQEQAGQAADALHPVLERQLRDATTDEDGLRVRRLIELVSRQYQEYDADRNSLATVAQIDTEDDRRALEALEHSAAARLRAILDHVKDGVLACDPYGRIESVNRTAERFFGVSQSELLSLSLDELFPGLAPDGNVVAALEQLATALDDTHRDLAATEVKALHRRGELMPAEVLVSRMVLDGQVRYVVCVRDAIERTRAEVELRDSEARYRVLVENAPEAVVVLDAENEKFVDCNDNAARFFRLTRTQLLQLGLVEVSAPQQPGGDAAELARQHIQRAVEGGAPVFEWLHRNADGRDVPTEVRLVRLPSSSGKLIRGSILDITDRKRAEYIAAGERRVFERIASNAGLTDSLEAITTVIEQVQPQTVCCIRLYDAERNVLTHAAGPGLPREYVLLMDEVPAEIRYGSCAAAIALQRQVIVPDIEEDPFWEYRREAATRSGLKACWSTLIRGADSVVLGTFATYMRATGLPSRGDLELMSRMTQLARIAIERHRAEQALRESEQRYRGLFDNVREGVYQVTLEGELLSANRALIDMLGYESFDDLKRVGRTDRLYVDPAERKRLVAELLEAGELVEAESRLRRRDGRIIVVHENARVMRDARGKVTGFEGTISDVTDRKQTERSLFREKDRALVTLQSIADAVITTDRNGVIDYMNPVAEALTEWRAEDAIGWPVREVVHLVGETSQDVIEDPVCRAVRDRKAVTLSDQTVLVGRNKNKIAIQANAAPIRDREGSVVGAVMVFNDVSRERRMKRLLSYQAAHDALTGLINRREFENRLGAALESARENPGARHVMVYVDLDQFKVVNDTCGHSAGDQLLRQVTGLLQTRIRTTDTLARLGGDEFGILLENCALDMAMRIAESLRQAIRDYRFTWHGTTLQVGASIGLVELTRDTQSVASLLSAADVACYSAKDGGRNRVHIYDPESASARHREMRWVARLTSASDEGRLGLVFQPIVPVGIDGEHRPHYELLLRLQDEEGKTVLPEEFIPAAERYNVIPILDRWVVEHVLRELVPSTRKGVHEAPYTVAVNISGTTLSDQSFLEAIIPQLDRYQPTPGSLCFEITETAAISNLANASYIMRELASRGCLVALDDFGSGLSSFNYLRTLPVHYLKIDGQFVQNVADDPVDRSLVEAVVQIGRAMGIETVAERVERQEVFDVLKEIGVSYVQGYLLGRPAPISEFPHK